MNRITCVIVTALFASFVPRVAAQFAKDPLLNFTLRQQAGLRSMADNLMDAVQSGAEYMRLKSEMAAQLETARRNFWAAYPDRPGFEEAAAEFERQLFRRDLYYLASAITTGAPSRQFAAMQVLTGGTMGYEIPFAAQRTFFQNWVTDLRQRLGAGDSNLVLVLDASRTDAFRAAMEASQDVYAVYVVRRNFEEFRHAGVTPPGFDPVHWRFVAGAVAELDQQAMPYRDSLEERPEYRGISVNADVYEQAEAFFQDSLRFFGEERVRTVAGEVFSSQPPYPCPAEMGAWLDPNPTVAAVNRLCSGAPRAFLFGQLRGGGRSFARWSETEKLYEMYVKWAGSEETLLAAVEKLRAAAKDPGVPEWGYAMLKQPAQFGSEDQRIDGCLKDMFGVGIAAIKSRARAQIDAGRQRARFDGEYVVNGTQGAQKYSGTLTIKPNADGTFTFTTTTSTRNVNAPVKYSGIGKWDLDIDYVSLDVTYADPKRPPMKYWVDFDGREIRGRSTDNRVSEKAINVRMYRELQTIPGTFEGTYSRAGGGRENGVTTISARSDGTFTVATEILGAKARRYQGVATWEGIRLKVVYADKAIAAQSFEVDANGRTLTGTPDFVILRKVRGLAESAGNPPAPSVPPSVPSEVPPSSRRRAAPRP